MIELLPNLPNQVVGFIASGQVTASQSLFPPSNPS